MYTFCLASSVNIPFTKSEADELATAQFQQGCLGGEVPVNMLNYGPWGSRSINEPPVQPSRSKCCGHFNSLQTCRPSLLLNVLKCFHHFGLANWQPRIDTVLICVFLVVQVEKGYERKPLKLVDWHSSIPGLIFFPLYSSHFDQENI